MKKPYIVPLFDIIVQTDESVLFTISMENGGNGSNEHPVTAKDSFFSDWDDDEDFYDDDTAFGGINF